MASPFDTTERYIPKNKKTEEGLQRQVASYLRKHYPHVDFNSDSAGIFLTPNQAKIRASLQSGRGWSDMFLAHPMKHKQPDGSEVQYCGLFLELKVEGTTIYVTRGPRKGLLVADQQIQIEAAFLQRVNKLGYFGRFAIGFDHTVRLIEWYFNKPQNNSLF